MTEPILIITGTNVAERVCNQTDISVVFGDTVYIISDTNNSAVLCYSLSNIV